MRRKNQSLLAKPEAKALDFLVARIPSAVTPDTLTFLAFLSAFLGGAAYALSGEEPRLLLVVSALLAVHWAADSLDGRLARYRKRERPRYGYYIDHLLDACSSGFLLIGLTVSAITSSIAWIVVFALMLFAMLHIALRAELSDIHEISLGAFGPTEARIGLVAMNSVLFLENPASLFLGMKLFLADIIGWIAVALFLAVLLPRVFRTARTLRKRDAQES